MCGGGGVGGVEPRGPEFSCETLRERTTLNSVDPGAVLGLRVGSILEIRAQSPTGPLAAIDPSGNIVGAITSASAAQILECIQGGHEYIAEVQSIAGGQIIVLVRHK